MQYLRDRVFFDNRFSDLVKSLGGIRGGQHLPPQGRTDLAEEQAGLAGHAVPGDGVGPPIGDAFLDARGHPQVPAAEGAANQPSDISVKQLKKF